MEAVGGIAVVQWLTSLGNTSWITGIASLCGIFGFAFTVAITIKTSNISKTLKKMNTASEFNDSMEAFQRSFEGHRLSIVVDNDHSHKIIRDVLALLQQYKYKFKDVFTWHDRWVIRKFEHELKKDSLNISFDKISIYLAEVSGRLSIKEDVNIGL